MRKSADDLLWPAATIILQNGLAKRRDSPTLGYGMKRFLRKALIGLAWLVAALVVLLALFYAEEDWRGARDWAACQKELAAKGESLDLRVLAPPGKPEDDLSKAPIFAELYQKVPPPEPRLKQISVYLKASQATDLPKLSVYLKGQPLDLVAWQTFYRSLGEVDYSRSSGNPAQDVLTVLQRFDPEMTEIDTAMSNPNAYWPINYNAPFDSLLSGITGMIHPAMILQLRAIAHLDNHETDLAEKDYLASFRLEQPLTVHSMTISFLVASGIRAIDEAILWEGLRRHDWSDTQLHEMESALSTNDMLGLATKALRTERGFGIQEIKYVQNGRYNLETDLTSDADIQDKLIHFVALEFLKCRPSGWATQELVLYNDEMQKQIDAIDVSNDTFDPNTYKNWTNPKTLPFWFKFNFIMPLLILAPYDKFGIHIAKAETYRRLARLACRLEEYRIAQGQYPEKLEELPDLPAHLNQEVLSEEPLRYERKGDGYLLYSVGWNQKDDGGVAGKDDKEGDWVWPSP